MITPVDLREISAFSDLPDGQIDWFLGHAEETALQCGDTFVRQGDPAEWMFVFLEGHFQWSGEFGGDIVSLPAEAGEISGVFPFSRMKRFTVTGRALSDARLCRFPVAYFPELIQKMPELTTRLVAMMSERIREGTRIEQMRDRSSSLGKLSAGLAHELNNPASAAKRAADQMRDMLTKMRKANSELWRLNIYDSDKARIEETEASLLQSKTVLDGLALSDLEERLDSILNVRGIANSWELSGSLAKCNMSPDALASLLTHLDPIVVRPALARISAASEMSILLSTIESASSRIANLIRTIKEYTYMDQAPVQDIDIAQSLETTLGILAHALQSGIEVKRNFEPAALLVSATGTELNQVWTNLIENAIEAMQGRGELRLKTFRDDKFVVAGIDDTGSGIPAEIRPYIFDPFFTTKRVGEGIGLGLNTAQTIVRKLGGNISVTSRPGDTRFQVRLPTAI